MRLLWQNITMAKKTGRTQWPSQQQSPLQQMMSAPVKVTKDFLPGPVAHATIHTLYQAAAIPLAYDVAGMAIPTTGNVCAAPRHSLDTYPEEKKMVTSGTDANPDPNAEEQGNQYQKPGSSEKNPYNNNQNKPKPQPQQQKFTIYVTHSQDHTYRLITICCPEIHQKNYPHGTS